MSDETTGCADDNSELGKAVETFQGNMNDLLSEMRRVRQGLDIRVKLAAKDAALRDAAEALDEAASDIRKFAGSAQRYWSGIEAGEKANKAARKAREAIG